ncbi:alpha/beta hydrolase [Isoptericola variabilis]|nr:alpha/beta hydrolase [Isoptericola variabilis]
MDVWLPEGATPLAPSPAVVFVHGGGWQAGDRSEVGPKVRPLLDAGLAVASVDYRLSGEAPFPAAVDDVRDAVRHLRGHGRHHGIDPDRIALWGESAGANIALVIGALGDRVAPWDTGPRTGAGKVSSAVTAVVDWYGPTDFLRMDAHAAEAGCGPTHHSADDSPESRYLGAPLRTLPAALVEQAGPLPFVRSATELPVFAIAHGTADCTVAPPQSGLLIDTLRAAGVEPWVTWLDGAGHSDPRFDAEVLGPTVEWLAEVLAR